MDIQIGDRITYKCININKEEAEIEIIKDNIMLNDYKNRFEQDFWELLKIERPQYEEIYKKGVITHHVTIETDKLKELILETHKDYWNDYTLKAKIEAVKRYAEFDNDTDLLEFLEFMEQ